MRRFIEFLGWEIQKWGSRALTGGAISLQGIDGASAGAKAYALRVAASRKELLGHARILFSKAPADCPAIVDDTGNPALDVIDVTQDLDLRLPGSFGPALLAASSASMYR